MGKTASSAWQVRGDCDDAAMVKLVSKQEFPPDEFDAMSETGPSGAHRRPVRRWHALLPILIVLVLGPALAWGGVALLKTTGKISDSATTTTTSPAPSATVSTPTAAPTKIAKPGDTDSPGSSADSQSPAPAANKENVRVRVLNASNRSGWAKEIADKLQSGGFTNPVATNSRARGLDGSTVLYNGEEYKAAAQEAAQLAGISNVKNAKEGGYQIGDSDIAIYLID